jgi:hypothetical protein
MSSAYSGTGHFRIFPHTSFVCLSLHLCYGFCLSYVCQYFFCRNAFVQLSILTLLGSLSLSLSFSLSLCLAVCSVSCARLTLLTSCYGLLLLNLVRKVPRPNLCRPTDRHVTTSTALPVNMRHLSYPMLQPLPSRYL